MTAHAGTGLRVAILARSVYPLHRFGGLERHVYDLVRCLLARDVRVTLITPPSTARRPDDAPADEVFRHQHLTLLAVPYVTFPLANRRGTTIVDRSTAYPLFGWRAGRAAARLAAAGNVDIVHGLGASALGYAMHDDCRRRVPLVLNPQGLEEFGATDPARAPLKRIGYWPLRVAVRRTARAAARVIATDRALVETVIGHLGIRREAVRVVPNAVELAECDRSDAAARGAALRAQIGLGPDDLLLLSVGRLEANKGFDVLIRALASISREPSLRRRWKWVLVGDGPKRAALQQAIADHQLEKFAVFWRRATAADLHGWYEAANLFVHPTLYEGSSLVTLEAMAHRRPVVGTTAGGLPDKVIDGVNGWLVRPGDARALADALRAAASDHTRLRLMGAESRVIVEREFSWTAATDRLMDVYRELLIG